MKPAPPTGSRSTFSKGGRHRVVGEVGSKTEPEPANNNNEGTAAASRGRLGFLKESLLHEQPASNDVETEPQDEVMTEMTAQSLNLSTGEDAISFFARYGKQSPIKFVHLNRARSETIFRPYDLMVVDAQKRDTNYYTMSEHGLVHIQPASPSEFIPLAEWMRQSTLFNVLTSIRCFKNYLINKCFCAWFSNIRYKLYCQQRKKLKNNLFLGKQSFCTPLLKIKEHMMEVQDVTLLDLSSKSPFESSAFVEFQASRRAEASKQFEAIMMKLQTEIQRVCTNVTNLARDTDSYEAMHDPTRSEKSKSLVSIKQEEQARASVLKRAEQEAGMLADFIRLADYVATENLMQLTIATNRDFLHELLKKRKTGLFETTVAFAEEDAGIEFNPPRESIVAMVSQMTDAMIQSVNSVSRILYIRPFTTYVENAVTDAPNVGQTIRASVAFQQIRYQIDERISESFETSQDYVTIFDSVRPIYKYDQAWDLDSYSKRTDHTVSSIKADMNQISQWKRELDKMKVGQTVGVLHVESRKLKQVLDPLNNDKLDAMKGLVKNLATQKCQEQLTEYRRRIQVIEARPTHLKDFSTQVEKLKELEDSFKDLTKMTAVVDELYRLLTLYEVDVGYKDMVLRDDLRSAQDR
jgi:dynein heavy chain